MVILGILMLILVLLRSVWSPSTESKTQATFTEAAQTYPLTIPSGKVQLIRWGQMEVGVLHLTPDMQATRVNVPEAVVESPLNPQTRAREPQYFVYVNKGSGVGCPIGFVNDYKRPVFQDTCTRYQYDLAGRPLDKTLKVAPLTVPPHHFKQAGTITLGTWE